MCSCEKDEYCSYCKNKNDKVEDKKASQVDIKILHRKIDSLKEDFRDKFKFIQKQIKALDLIIGTVHSNIYYGDAVEYLESHDQLDKVTDPRAKNIVKDYLLESILKAKEEE